MLRMTIIISAAITAVTIGTPLAAQSVDQDVRCWIASNVVARQEKDPGRKQFAGLAVFYYLGRLDARLSTQQLKAAATTQAKAMNGTDLGPMMRTCATRLIDRQKALQAMSQQAAPPTAK